ncbi:MAG: hypothetical protein ABI723_24730 [Bacteroidia bacterium]
MKQLTLKLVIPLTAISFSIFTKWWFTLPVDGPDTILTGFPFPFVCNGWHTSMSLQIFVAELFVDLLTYFAFWFITIYCINRFFKVINVHIILTILLLSLTGLILTGSVFIASNSDNLFYFKRPWDMEIMETGYKFTWQNQTHPDFYKYHPESKKE